MMPNASLQGTWVHSYEEDQGDLQVYRPGGQFAFPPGRRARETLEFGEGGRAGAGMPGPDDRLQRSPMTPLGMNRYRMASGQELEIMEQGPDVLKVRIPA